MKYGHWPFRLDRSDAPPIIVYITIAHNATAQAVIEAATLDAIPFINTPDRPDVHLICDNPALAAAFILGAAPALSGRDTCTALRSVQCR